MHSKGLESHVFALPKTSRRCRLRFLLMKLRRKILSLGLHLLISATTINFVLYTWQDVLSSKVEGLILFEKVYLVKGKRYILVFWLSTCFSKFSNFLFIFSNVSKCFLETFSSISISFFFYFFSKLLFTFFFHIFSKVPIKIFFYLQHFSFNYRYFILK